MVADKFDITVIVHSLKHLIKTFGTKRTGILAVLLEMMSKNIIYVVSYGKVTFAHYTDNHGYSGMQVAVDIYPLSVLASVRRQKPAYIVRQFTAPCLRDLFR